MCLGGSSVFKEIDRGAVGKADCQEEQPPVILGRCGGLSENGNQRRRQLNAWFPVGRIAWEGLRIAVFLERARHLGTDLGILKDHANYCQFSVIPTCG